MRSDKRGRTFFVNFRDKGTVLLSLSANFIITADAFASAAIFGVEKRMGVILSHWGFCENPEGEESLFTACLTKNGICDKLEKRYYIKGVTKRHVHVVTSISSDVA